MAAETVAASVGVSGPEDQRTQKYVKDLLFDIGWNKRQYVREWIARANECDWDCSNAKLRLFTWKGFAGVGNTKVTMEDLINQVHDLLSLVEQGCFLVVCCYGCFFFC